MAQRRSAIALFCAFASLGAVGATIPASIPATASRLRVAADQLLPAVSLLFLGLLVGVLLAALSRTIASALLPAGLALETVGLALVAASGTATTFLVAAATAGVGFGIVEASATALSRTLAAEGTPKRLAALNGASAVAAAVAPALITVTPSRSLAITILVIALVPACGVAVAIGSSSLRLPRSRQPPAAWPAPRKEHRRELILVGTAIFLFVGAESVLSGWSSVLPQALLQMPPAYAAIGTAAFWVLMASGRFGCTMILGRGVSVRRYFIASGALAAGAVAVAGVMERTTSAVLLCAVVLLIAPGYALLLGHALASVPAALAGRRASVMIIVGSAGGAISSFAVAETFGTTPSAVLFSVGGLVAAAVTVLAASTGRSSWRCALRLPARR
ncbi:MAG: MFS transporter [Microbacteriaceae bacterium]